MKFKSIFKLENGDIIKTLNGKTQLLLNEDKEIWLYDSILHSKSRYIIRNINYNLMENPCQLVTIFTLVPINEI